MGNNIKKILRIHPGNGFHWVGDGFRVNNYFPGHVISATDASPFFLLDYNAPVELTPSNRPRGVGSHPHKGFETVSIIWEGAVSHQDSAGNSGSIGPGDVQWMTAGSGILHKEFHEAEFTRTGGQMHMVQLWVNLPAVNKSAPPAYQDLRDSEIPRVLLPENAGILRIIAGKFNGINGAAKTFSPLHLFDVTLKKGKSLSLNVEEGETFMILLASGQLQSSDEKLIGQAHLAYFDRAGSVVEVLATEDAHFLVLTGKPLNEPIAHYGPFVMNTQEEIIRAVEEFRSGQFGVLD